MNNWTSGYVADVGYTYGYYSELNPQRVKFALLNQGLAFPTIETACELGFGQGVSINVHAAASLIDWYGNDFNPSQAAFAREMAVASGSGANLNDEAFLDFVNRDDLPDFDYISLHGIWSWISDQNRTVISDFVRKKLKVGGVLYVSYNTLPGWANFAPIRHLMTEHAEVFGAQGDGIISRIDGALGFIEKLFENNPKFLNDNPQIRDRLNTVKDQNRNYVAHEYFNRDWRPMYFSEMAKYLDNAKVQFAGSVDYIEMLDVVNFTAEQRQFLDKCGDPNFRQLVKDFMTNQQFRRDYWVKGIRHLSSPEKNKALNSHTVMLTTAVTDVSLTAKTKLGVAKLQASVYEPILDVIRDNKPHTIEEIVSNASRSGVSFQQVVQAITVLCGKADVQLVQDAPESSEIKKQVDAINEWIMQGSHGSNQVNFLASRYTGGGVSVGRFNQMFLTQQKRGVKTPAEWAENVWNILETQGEVILKDGKPLTSRQENIAELTIQARKFSEKSLPILKALGIS